jgi:uncharacterized membrane protein YphA (DoxX/SURF4 family)
MTERRLDTLMTIIQQKPDLSWLLNEGKRNMKNELSHQQTSGRGGSALWRKPIMTSILWVVQVLLALFFLYGGAIKLVPPSSAPGAALLASLLSALPKLFVYFIGITEVLGALGLILPVLLRILPILTPLAAVGLIIEMIGATIFVILFYGVAPAAFPVVTGLLLAFVASGCWLRLKTVSSDGLRNFRHVSIR